MGGITSKDANEMRQDISRGLPVTVPGVSQSQIHGNSRRTERPQLHARDVTHTDQPVGPDYRPSDPLQCAPLKASGCETGIEQSVVWKA